MKAVLALLVALLLAAVGCNKNAPAPSTAADEGSPEDDIGALEEGDEMSGEIEVPLAEEEEEEEAGGEFDNDDDEGYDEFDEDEE